MFNYDWFHGLAYEQQKTEARWSCALQHFSDLAPEQVEDNEDFQKFREELEDRTLVYLRDGFSYEVRRISEVASKSHLVFECMPADEHYKVGVFIVTVPFDEIVRVEVYAVHPEEKPGDSPQITGFKTHGEPSDHQHPELARPSKPLR